MFCLLFFIYITVHTFWAKRRGFTVINIDIIGYLVINNMKLQFLLGEPVNTLSGESVLTKADGKYRPDVVIHDS